MDRTLLHRHDLTEFFYEARTRLYRRLPKNVQERLKAALTKSEANAD
jgi:hypothetical protein